ncbi:MAG: hypothetical protein ABI321_07735, partial [Polyangia bacterium]
QLARFSLRGLTAVKGEWAMLCTAHNLLKLARRRPDRVSGRNATVPRLKALPATRSLTGSGS